jgi:hypothetical protein
MYPPPASTDPVEMTDAELIANGKANIERRSSERVGSSSIAVEFERLRNELALSQLESKGYRETCEEWQRVANELSTDADRLRTESEARARIVAHQAQHIDQLLTENKRFREVITKAAKLIERRASTKGERHAETH